jgi:serine/threonine protein phosphatase PrpC
MINMSRSLGDLHAHSQGVSAEPDVSVTQLHLTQETVLLLASDGVWDVFEPLEAVEFVVQRQQA